MHLDLRNSSSANASLEVTLDGWPVALPPQRRSLASIRTYLETLAMEQQRVLCSLALDGEQIRLAEPVPAQKPFVRIEATTIDLAQMPLQLLRTAMLQTADTKAKVSAAVTLVVINDPARAREHWWHLAQALTQPLLTLSLMPEPRPNTRTAGASIPQLRKWQLQQLATIIQDVDRTCWSEDSTALSNALEHRVLPWLCALQATLDLWHEMLSTPALVTRDE
jgi:hypothetical protein